MLYPHTNGRPERVFETGQLPTMACVNKQNLCEKNNKLTGR